MISPLSRSLSPLASRTSPRATFSPASIVGLTLWLRADRGTFADAAKATPCKPGDPVACWADQSGQGNDATQARSTARPTLAAGPAALAFDLGASGMTTAATFANNPFSIFLAYQPDDPTVTGRRALNGSNNWLLGPYANNQTYFSNGFTYGGAVAYGVPCLMSVVQTTTALDFRVNGARTTATGGLGTPGTLGLGTAGAFAEPLGGRIFEVLAYAAALTESGRQAVETYLMSRWAITAR